MLNSMTRGTLHLGIGRGTAKMEYDAYNVDMNEARARFAEVLRIVEKGLRASPSPIDGTFWKIERPIRIGPNPCQERAFLRRDRQSCERRGDGRPRHSPDLPSTFPDGLLVKILRPLARPRRRQSERRDPADFGQDVHRRYR